MYEKRVIVVSDNKATIYIHSWTSKRISNEQIKAPGTSTNNDLAPASEYNGSEIKLKFPSDVLKQNKVTYNHGKIVNIYIVYQLFLSSNDDITPKNSLFGAVKITKNADISKYNYSGYGLFFDSGGSF